MGVGSKQGSDAHDARARRCVTPISAGAAPFRRDTPTGYASRSNSNSGSENASGARRDDPVASEDPSRLAPEEPPPPCAGAGTMDGPPAGTYHTRTPSAPYVHHDHLVSASLAGGRSRPPRSTAPPRRQPPRARADKAPDPDTPGPPRRTSDNAPPARRSMTCSGTGAGMGSGGGPSAASPPAAMAPPAPRVGGRRVGFRRRRRPPRRRARPLFARRDSAVPPRAWRVERR